MEDRERRLNNPLTQEHVIPETKLTELMKFVDDNDCMFEIITKEEGPVTYHGTVFNLGKGDMLIQLTNVPQIKLEEISRKFTATFFGS